jgi:hypothetical protein
MKNIVNGKEYFWINEELLSSTEEIFVIKNEKFSFECTPINNKYFPVPNDFTNLFYHNNNYGLRTVCLYLLNHSYGKIISKDVWLDKDDLINGRKCENGDDRYDGGLGLDESCIWRALQKGVEEKIIVWTDKNYDGSNRKLYNLKFEGDLVDENNKYLGTLPWEKPIKNYKKEVKTTQAKSVDELLGDHGFIPKSCNSTKDSYSEKLQIDEFAYERYIIAYTNYINAFTSYVDTCQIPGFTTNPNYSYAIEPLSGNDQVSNIYLETKPISNGNRMNVDDHRMNVDDHCMNVDDHCMNVDDHCMNVDDHCMDVDDHCMNVDDDCINVGDYCMNVDEHCKNVEKQEVKEKPNNYLIKELIKKPEVVKVNYNTRISSAVISGDKKAFLKSLGVRNPNLQKICDLQITDEYIFAWTLFKHAHPDFRDNPELGFLVKSLLDNADPPMEYLLISNLSVENWLDIFVILSDEQNKYDPQVYLLKTELQEVGLICKKILGSSIKSRIPKKLAELSINLLLEEEQND